MSGVIGTVLPELGALKPNHRPSQAGCSQTPGSQDGQVQQRLSQDGNGMFGMKPEHEEVTQTVVPPLVSPLSP